MKADIHPEYVDAIYTCTCGSVLHTRSTKRAVHIEICSKCHPFYTGQQRLVDTAGRVERFRRKYARSAAAVRSKAKEPAPRPAARTRKPSA